MRILIVLDRPPCDGSDVTWNGRARIVMLIAGGLPG
jgi:hypothetical protein